MGYGESCAVTNGVTNVASVLALFVSLVVRAECCFCRVKVAFLKLTFTRGQRKASIRACGHPRYSELAVVELVRAGGDHCCLFPRLC